MYAVNVRSNVVDFMLQYMFGESFLVAPVIAKDAVEWSVYLPAGETWLDVGSTFQVCSTHHMTLNLKAILCIIV